MSGFEIAGAVLGAFPILLQAANGLRGVYSDARTWWQFEREFDDFVAAVEREHIAFSQILEILLEPLYRLSYEEREELQTKPNSPLWTDERIEAELRERVSERYFNWFKKELRGLQTAVEELAELLPMYQGIDLDTASLEREAYKLRMSFTHRKDTLLAKVGKSNKSLYDFFVLQGQIPRVSMPAPEAGSAAKVSLSFLDSQRRAQSLYECLQHRWANDCSCTGGHPCSITAEGKDLKVLFGSDTNDRRHIRVEVAMTGLPTPKQGEVPSSTPDSKLEKIHDLRRQLSFKSRLIGRKRKGRRRIRRMFLAAAPGIWNLLRLGNDTQGNSKGMSVKPPEQPEVPPTTKHQANDGAGTGTANAGDKRVKFASSAVSCAQEPQPLAAVQSQVAATAIVDMCLVVKQRQQATTTPCLGYIESGPSISIILHLDPPNQQLPDPETFESFLLTTPRRGDRLRLGHRMILMLLKLGPGWIPNTWSKKSLVVLRSTNPAQVPTAPAAITQPQPYISHASIQTALKPSAGTAAAAAATAVVHIVESVAQVKARASLLTLGILLLELLFGETLEGQPCWSEFLSGGKPNEFTEFCTAMKWSGKVEGEFGNKFAEAIRRCLTCGLEPAPDLASPAFVRAVWTGVAQPVEEFVAAF